MDDSSEDEISENSDVDMEDSEETKNKQRIGHENAMFKGFTKFLSTSW